jgi:hypothetical protein
VPRVVPSVVRNMGRSAVKPGSANLRKLHNDNLKLQVRIPGILK